MGRPWVLGLAVLTTVNWVFGIAALCVWAVLRWTNLQPGYLSAALMLIAGAMLARAPWPSESYAGDSVLVARSEEHTSELQSRGHLVCRLLLEKKKDDTL